LPGEFPDLLAALSGLRDDTYRQSEYPYQHICIAEEPIAGVQTNTISEKCGYQADQKTFASECII
jgi:hypothetical protein